MTGHLCLKWNNHSSAFLKSISTIQIKERYCDATIACQGKYFPVHRIILSTCSDYFEEIFERMQSPHPYIVFKDIEPREMELLLNYMYQGEVNVVQDMLPSLIKAAEALRIKGLAVPDEMPPVKDSSSGKKRSNTSNENPQSKRRSDEGRRRRMDSSESSAHSKRSDGYFDNGHGDNLQSDGNEPRLIKSEPLDSGNYGDDSLPNDDAMSSHPSEAQSVIDKEESIFSSDFPAMDPAAVYVKSEANVPPEEPFNEESSTWNDFMNANVMGSLPPPDMAPQDDVNGGGGSSSSHRAGEQQRAPAFQKWPPPPLKENAKRYQCRHCPYACSFLSTLKRHAMFKHPTGERPFPCSLCSARFILKVDLRRHLATHIRHRAALELRGAAA